MPIIEVVTFKLNQQATAEQLTATNSAMQDFLNQQQGFQYRSLSCDEEGQWFDIVYWESMEAAKRGGEAFMKSAVCAGLMPLIDSGSVNMRHMDAVSAILSEKLAA